MAKGDRDKRLVGIGGRVRQRRRELELTQEQLARVASLSKSFLSDIESGQTAASGLNYLALAEALDVEVQWLLTGAVAQAAHQEPAPVEIPPVLSEVADEEGWSHGKTLDVAATLRAIAGRRTRGGRQWQPSRDYILRVEKALTEDGSK